MDKVRISLSSPIYGISPIKTKSVSIVRMEDSQTDEYCLKIQLPEKELSSVFIGNELTFVRKIRRNEDTETISNTVEVIGKGDDYVLTNLLGTPRIYLLEEDTPEEELEDRPLTAMTYGDSDIYSDYSNASSPIVMIYDDNEKLIGVRLNFKAPHNIFLQDVSRGAITLKGYNGKGKKVIDIASNRIHILKDNGALFAEKKDTNIIKTREDCNGKHTDEEYVYMPDEFINDSLFIDSTKESEWSERIVYFEVNENPFYKQKGGLWDDPWSDEEIVSVNKNTGYWVVPDVISVASNDFSLGGDEVNREALADELWEESLPPVINMEREKYIPIIKEEEKIIRVKELEFNFHFREREKEPVSFDENGNFIFKEGWYINPDNTTGWNESGNGFSDLVGYLGFTDDDVYYRKNKIKKSFIRLSFYTSPNPLDQRLLYYSTIFMDSARLYSNYLSHNRGSMDNNGWTSAATLTNSADTEEHKRIEAKFNVTNEYDRTRSSEGFNCYLFADDADRNLDKNGERTLYMTVEFNHAGYGKTLPMLPMKDKELKGGVEVSNYLERLYIPVKIGHQDNTFYYYFDDDTEGRINNGKEDKKIVFTLYEPKLKS